MCIIVYKPASEKMPSKSLLRRLYEKNPDGAGFMYADGEKVIAKKGFMTFPTYWKAIERERVGRENMPWSFHMRIATHGGTTTRLCHPFPVTSNLKTLTRCEFTSDYAVMHNGIISLTSYATNISDTAEYVRSYLAPLASVSNFTPWSLDLIEESIGGSRLLIMDGAGRVELLGMWHESGGLWFSNDGYKKPDRARDWKHWYNESIIPYDWDAEYKRLARAYGGGNLL